MFMYGNKKMISKIFVDVIIVKNCFFVFVYIKKKKIIVILINILKLFICI